MKTITITQSDLNADNEYVGDGIFDGNLLIEACLGVVKFKGNLLVDGWIITRPGTGIKAGAHIKAGWSLMAGWSLTAGESIEADGSLITGGSISAGTHIKAGVYIKAVESIEAGTYIKAGAYIEAGESIEAGTYIEAGESIKAGFSICAQTIICRLRIFAGLCSWRPPEPDEMEVRAKTISGTVCFGTVVTPENREAAQ